MMKIYSWEQFTSTNHSRTTDSIPHSVTFGVFDGVHRAHSTLLSQVVKHAKAVHGLSVVFTFRFIPKQRHILMEHKHLQTTEQRLWDIQSIGIDVVVLIDFSDQFRTMKGREFLDMLNRKLNLCYVALGDDLKIGHHGEMDSEKIRAYLTTHVPGIHVEMLSTITTDNQRISSTQLRIAVVQGDMLTYRRIAGKPFELVLPPHRPSKERHTLLLPPPGVYTASGISEDRNYLWEEKKVSLDSKGMIASGSINSLFAVQLLEKNICEG